VHLRSCISWNKYADSRCPLQRSCYHLNAGAREGARHGLVCSISSINGSCGRIQFNFPEISMENPCYKQSLKTDALQVRYQTSRCFRKLSMDFTAVGDSSVCARRHPDHSLFCYWNWTTVLHLCYTKVLVTCDQSVFSGLPLSLSASPRSQYASCRTKATGLNQMKWH
jgi:hypothetical protein